MSRADRSTTFSGDSFAFIVGGGGGAGGGIGGGGGGGPADWNIAGMPRESTMRQSF